MIIINQLKVRPGYSPADVENKILSSLKILPEELIDYRIERESIDARKKADIFIVLSVSCNLKHENSVLRRNDPSKVSLYKPVEYCFNATGTEELNHRPVIVGAGPAGLFAAYFLAKAGYKPIVLERGFDVDTRSKDVEGFWETGNLKRNSNVLFGEGGAGTFSDGKLNTLVKDKSGRNREVLKTFVTYGAKESILYEAKPHIGTDVLRTVIKSMREDIKRMGGEFRFNAEVTDFEIEKGIIKAVIVNQMIKLETDICILAIGHSARDTFKWLYEKGIFMEQKDFAVGVRIEHKQKTIDRALYSDDEKVLSKLPPAAYKLAYTAKNNRGVYSFCMCPGGYVVNASSEPGYLCVNGMSYSGRNGENANSAIVVTVSKDDYLSSHPLAGIEFQRTLEKNAYSIGNGAVPTEIYRDFKQDLGFVDSFDEIDLNFKEKPSPQIKGTYTKGKVSSIFPLSISEALVEGIEYFDRIIPGFADDYAILSGVESRTSSPVRITRGDNFESINIKGLYPCGEGAGYAGGITSAAMDGMKIAERIAAIYKPIQE